MIKAIYTYDKKNIILVGNPTWSQDVDIVADSPVIGYQKQQYQNRKFQKFESFSSQKVV